MSAKSVLITTDAFVLGGMETRLLGEIHELFMRECRIYLATDSAKFDLELLRKHPYISVAKLKFSGGFDLQNLIANVDMLRALICKNKIDLICSHGFHSSLASAIAAQLEGVTFITTIHGPGAVLGISPIAKFILERAVFDRADRINCISREIYSIVKPSVPNADIAITPNLIDTDQFSPRTPEVELDPRWVIVSRLSNEKLHGIVSFLEIAFLAGIPGVVIFGDGPIKKKIESVLDQAGIVKYVEFRGSNYSISKILNGFSGAAGVGRVILEAIASEVPACVLGYNGGIKGLVDTSNFHRFQHSNFSGRNMPTISLTKFRSSLSNIQHSEMENLRELAKMEIGKTQLHLAADDYQRPYEKKSLLALETFYTAACFFESKIKAPYINSDIFIEDVLLPAFSMSFKTTKAHLAWSDSFFKQISLSPNSDVELDNIALRVAVEDNSIVASTERCTLSAKESITLDASPYIKAPGSHRIRCEYSIKKYKDFLRPPALLSIRFESSNESIKDMNIAGLAISPIQDVGYYRYFETFSTSGDAAFEFDVPKGYSVKEAVIRTWNSHQDTPLDFEYLRLIAFNI